MGWRGILGFEYGIVQAPLGPDISGPDLVAAVANAGAIATLRAPDWECPDYVRELIRKTRALTDKPFGVGIVLAFPHEENIKAILDEKVAFLQVYWGEYPEELVLKAHHAGVKIMHQVGSVEEAEKAIKAGVDAIIVQGCEAGGHVIGQDGLMALLPRVVDLGAGLDIPIIAAGSIVDGSGYVAALALGAQGVCLGTRFLATEESYAHPLYKRKLVEINKTEYTTIYGRARWPNAPHRVLQTPFHIDSRLLPDNKTEANQPVLGHSTIHGTEKEIRRYAGTVPNATTTGDIESMVMYAGEGVGRIKEILPAVKPHAVFIPYPAQGHVTPMMQLAKLIHSRGSHVTFVNTEFNHQRLLRSKGPDSLKGLPDFRFKTIPDGLPPSDKDATQEIPPLCESTRKNCLQPLVDLVLKLNTTSDIPNVTLIVSDGVMSFGVKAGEILGIPEVQFWTASACGFMGYIHFSELIKRGLTPLKDESYLSNGYLETSIDWIPGMKNIRLKDLPSFIRTTDPDDIMLHFMGEQAQNCLKASAIIYNTFDELEHEVLEAISSKYPNIYTIGPLPLLAQQLPETELNSMRSNLWKEDTSCLDWLDKRESKSVVYVNFGSITVMTNDHLREFAWGLANSNHPFLWILRADAVMGDSASIPDEFFEVTEDRGMIVSWCPQDKVLSHPSIGGFLTHSGWNSTLETICAGVPVICWPFFCEQQTNCRYACTTWEFGMEIDSDVKREEIEVLVKELIGGVEGMKMRNNALKWKEKAEEATRQGGSSYKNFDRVINEVLYQRISK